MLFPLGIDFILPATPVCTETICLTLVSVVASPKLPKQTQGAGSSQPKGSERILAVISFSFLFFIFIFLWRALDPLFQCLNSFFFTCFLLASPHVLLLGIFRLLRPQRSWWFVAYLIALHSFHFCPAGFGLELPLLSAFYVLLSRTNVYLPPPYMVLHWPSQCFTQTLLPIPSPHRG